MRTGMLERGVGLLKQRDPLCPPKTCPENAPGDGHCLEGSPVAAFPLVPPGSEGTQRSGDSADIQPFKTISR